MPTARSLILCSFLALAALSFYHFDALADLSSTRFRAMTVSWSSNISGYLQKATPYPNPHSYIPKRSALKLVVLKNAKSDPEGYTLAIFDDGVSVDAQGRIATLAEEHYDHILKLAEQVAALPETGAFRNQWRVDHPITGRSIERILKPRQTLEESPKENYEEEYIETSVYGYDKRNTKLVKPTNGYTDLPPPLWELTGLALEADNGGDGERDQVVLQRVRAILGNVF